MSELLMKPTLFLASTSPRRRELLQQIGLSFEVLRVDVDESTQVNELPEAYVQRLSLAKAQMGLTQCPNDALVLAADTTVVIDNHIIGKPETLEQAILYKIYNGKYFVLFWSLITFTSRSFIYAESIAIFLYTSLVLLGITVAPLNPSL